MAKKNKNCWTMTSTPLIPFVGRSMVTPSKEYIKWTRDAKTTT
jgi:hypothetical protein